MSLLSAEFYGRPQDELTVVGITGTKGKTTTAYFTQAVLNATRTARQRCSPPWTTAWTGTRTSSPT